MKALFRGLINRILLIFQARQRDYRAKLFYKIANYILFSSFETVKPNEINWLKQ